ncbi:MAG: hypothetical protein ACLPH5_20065, partial [Candidatus Sulfotelmatobacter sp.]
LLCSNLIFYPTEKAHDSEAVVALPVPATFLMPSRRSNRNSPKRNSAQSRPVMAFDQLMTKRYQGM